VRIPEPLRSQVVEGRHAAAEVTASASGRRAFVAVRPVGGAPTLEESLARAQAEGRIPRAHAFVGTKTEYDANHLKTWDYDLGSIVLAEAEVPTIEAVEATLEAWTVDGPSLRPYSDTDAP
jgi:hypothetical protein